MVSKVLLQAMLCRCTWELGNHYKEQNCQCSSPSEEKRTPALHLLYDLSSLGGRMLHENSWLVSQTGLWVLSVWILLGCPSVRKTQNPMATVQEHCRSSLQHPALGVTSLLEKFTCFLWQAVSPDIFLHKKNVEADVKLLALSLQVHPSVRADF